MSEVFLTVFNAGVMAAWVVLAVLILRLLLHKAPAWVRCALWGIVGLRLVWPFRVESPVSLVPSAQTLPAGQLYDYTPELDTGISALDHAVNPGFTQTFASEVSNSVNPLQVAVTVAGWIWLAGVAVMAVYALVSYLRLRSRVAMRMPVEGNVYLCDRIPTPFILGIVKPKIYLPSDLPEETWETILAHERAHLKRRDHWWKPLGFALLAVHWFNPLLWVAYILLCRDIELACDEKVIAALTAEEKKTYSETLLRCSAGKAKIAACPLAFGETGVKQRIKAVLQYKKPALWILIAAVLICAVTAVCFLTQREVSVSERTFVITECYGDSLRSYVPSFGTIFQMTEDGARLESGFGSWIEFDQVEECTLPAYTGEGATYDSYAQIRRFVTENNKRAWRLSSSESEWPTEYYFLQQNNGELFLYYEGYYFRLETIDAQRTPARATNTVWLQVEYAEGNDMYATDVDGNYWRICGEGEYFDSYYNVWVSFRGKPRKSEAVMDNGETVAYEITPDRCWWTTATDKEPYRVYDACMFDIDRDGKKEQCILSRSPTSGMLTYKLSVWDGDTCEASVIFYSYSSIVGAAFATEGNRLLILTPDYSTQDQKYTINTIEVSCKKGDLKLTDDGEPVDIFSE